MRDLIIGFIAGLVFIFTAKGALAESPKQCHDKAGFAYFAADAHYRGVPLQVFHQRIVEFVAAHPELGATDADVRGMLALSEEVFGSELPPDLAYEAVFAGCSLKED